MTDAIPAPAGTNAVPEPPPPAKAERRFELLDATSLEDPYPLYEQMRRLPFLSIGIDASLAGF